MVKPIGGFFELELPQGQGSYHPGAVALSNGRACLGLLLDQLQPPQVWVPFYTCNALLTPLQGRNIPYRFYHLTPQLEILEALNIGPRELLIYVNYFGLQQDYIRTLEQRYGNQLIVDNTQAFFERGYPQAASFNSARKFFGVPDGGYLYSPQALANFDLMRHPPNIEIHWDHLIHRFLGQQAVAYPEFVASEQASTAAVLQMSSLSQALLSTLDYATIAQQRRRNFAHCHQALAHLNHFPLPHNWAIATPFCYPLLFNPLSADPLSIDTPPPDPPPPDRATLFAAQLFIPLLWNDVLTRPDPGFELEQQLTQHLLPLPIDHRYRPTDLDRMIAAVLQMGSGPGV